jgi:hypothetical protein
VTGIRVLPVVEDVTRALKYSLTVILVSLSFFYAKIGNTVEYNNGFALKQIKT